MKFSGPFYNLNNSMCYDEKRYGIIQINPWLVIIFLIILVVSPVAFWKMHKKAGFSGLQKWICRIGLIRGIILMGCLIMGGRKYLRGDRRG